MRGQRAVPSLTYYSRIMATTTNLPNAKLSAWYYAVKWGKYHVEQSVARSAALGFESGYDAHQLQYLEDLEQFLKMSWDEWMESLVTGQTTEEFSCGL